MDNIEVINKIKMDNITYHGIGTLDFLDINWHILYECNYKCSYCFGSNTLTKDFISIDKLKHAVDQVFKINVNQYNFTLLGGEVTFYPYFLDLVEYIYSFNKNISMLLITNGSKSIDYFQKLLSLIKDNSFLCVLSVHLEYASLEHIKELIKLFNKNNRKLALNFMVHPALVDKTKEYFDELAKFRYDYIFDINLMELREPPEFSNVDKRYTKELFDWIDNSRNLLQNNNYKINNEFYSDKIFPNSYFTLDKNYNNKNISIDHNIAIRNNLKNFNGFYCLGGTTLINILPNGDYSGGICGNLPILGNIYENEIDIIKIINPIQCHLSQCGCDANDRINKYKYFDEFQNNILSFIKNNSDLFLDNLKFIINKNTELTNKNTELTNKNTELVNKISRFIPIKKWRDNLRNKYI
ncbi:radical SAM protein [Brachyspira pulli]|uniref:radical SAM protein n=1 Tax=Brachyspira pulli TaxID=310721 RepID=UPI003003C34F